MSYPLLRSALCLVVLAVCFAALQCTANTSGADTNDNGAGSESGGSTSGPRSLVNAALDKIIDFFAVVIRKATNKTSTNVDISNHNFTSDIPPVNTTTDQVVDHGEQEQTAQSTTTTTTNTGTSDAQDVTQTTDGSGDTSVKQDDAQDVTQTTTGDNTNVQITSSQTTASATSVQTVMSTSSTAAPNDSTQTSATLTTETAKRDSTAAAKLLQNLPNALQSVEHKDGIVGCSSVFALSALVTLVVMAVSLSF